MQQLCQHLQWAVGPSTSLQPQAALVASLLPSDCTEVCERVATKHAAMPTGRLSHASSAQSDELQNSMCVRSKAPCRRQIAAFVCAQMAATLPGTCQHMPVLPSCVGSIPCHCLLLPLTCCPFQPATAVTSFKGQTVTAFQEDGSF